MIIDFSTIYDYIPFLIQGVIITVGLALVGAFFGLIGGLILALTTQRKSWLASVARQFVDLIRGTPLLFQVALFHLALPQVFPVLKMDPFISVGIVFSVNSAAYLSEIIRSGIQQVSKDQLEAATCLGLTVKQQVISIIIPQTIRNILPALANELIALIKETSIVSFVGLQDLMRRQAIVSATTYRYFEPLIIVGIIYYALTKVVSIVSKQIERKINHD